MPAKLANRILKALAEERVAREKAILSGRLDAREYDHQTGYRSALIFAEKAVTDLMEELVGNPEFTTQGKGDFYG